ncbi:hypothetical protein ACIPJG_34060 [Streptomyces halstedii]|uniref:hypothetical protein n=1 Tax=Streptomyces halstedii TaxID=1944 RepID=UPI0038023972
MDRQTAIEEAAREVLAHGGPEARTDAHTVVAAMDQALNAGATHADIATEMRRQRDQ